MGARPVRTAPAQFPERRSHVSVLPRASRWLAEQIHGIVFQELRQRNFLKDDPMYLFCKPPGGPRQYEQAYGFQFVEDPDFSRIWVLLASGNRNRREIWTDGRKQEGQINGDADNP